MTKYESLFGTATLVVPRALDSMRAAEAIEAVPDAALRSLAEAKEWLGRFLEAVEKADEATC